MTRLRVLMLVAVVALASACSNSKKPAAAPSELLAAAKQTLDQTASVHVALSGADLPSSGNVLRAANGDATHPDKFKGSVSVTISGLPVSIAVVSVSGVFFAQLPGASAFTRVDPTSYGLTDPGRLISPAGGISTLLTADPKAKADGQTRRGSEVLEKVGATLPGALVGSLLKIADPAATVNATFAINATTKQLRWADLTGPFYAKDTNNSYRLTITDYGKGVDIVAPATG